MDLALPSQAVASLNPTRNQREEGKTLDPWKSHREFTGRAAPHQKQSVKGQRERGLREN